MLHCPRNRQGRRISRRLKLQRDRLKRREEKRRRKHRRPKSK